MLSSYSLSPGLNLPDLIRLFASWYFIFARSRERDIHGEAGGAGGAGGGGATAPVAGGVGVVVGGFDAIGMTCAPEG